MTGPADLGELIFALAIFLVTHVIPALRPLRRALVGIFGERVYVAAYSALSLAVLGGVGWAFRRAPYLETWGSPPWAHWVPILAMPFALLLLGTALARPNPFSVGRGGKGFDPDRPGLLKLTRHPLMAALALWALCHLIANGDWAAVLLFGLFLALALAGPELIASKKRRSLGEAEWRRLDGLVRSAPFRWRDVGWFAPLFALIGYAALLSLHPWLFGVDPLDF